jgi:hypothetical protein
MRVENPKLVVEPGAGRTGKLAMVAYQFQQLASGSAKPQIISRSSGASVLNTGNEVNFFGFIDFLDFAISNWFSEVESGSARMVSQYTNFQYFCGALRRKS